MDGGPDSYGIEMAQQQGLYGSVGRLHARLSSSLKSRRPRRLLGLASQTLARMLLVEEFPH